ncbi:unnamed protein product, partial [Porites evermanni]
TAPPGYCRSFNRSLYKIGDTWKPNPLETCSCTPSQFIACSIIHPPIVIACRDSSGNTRKPGDTWLDNPQSKCNCTKGNFVICDRLLEPICQDISGVFRKNMDTWTKGSCVECACINGTINCNQTIVNITYGLLNASVFPISELYVSQAPQTSSACKAFYDNKSKLIRCEREGFFIRDNHRCNGIEECPDGSDEKGCENEICKDEEGGTFLINESLKGWNVSPCLSCQCKDGLTTCKRDLTINFPGYFRGMYSLEQNCTQPSCSVLKFIQENKDWCHAVELIQNRGIIFEGQTWKFEGCTFYFPGVRNSEYCPSMTRPVCYVYNGAICCASECSVLQQIGSQMRGNLTYCPSGRQLDSDSSRCRNSSNCSQNLNIDNCLSVVTCQDEDSNQYFEGTKWSVGSCIKCSCAQGKIHCSRTAVLVSFLQLSGLVVVASDQTFIEYCNQTSCNVASFVKANKEICYACRWNGKLYYEGDHWKENGVEFYCISISSQKVRPGCYVENGRIACTGAIPGIQNLSLISRDALFLCDSGDEIRSLGDRCNIKPECADLSDEKDCDNYYCPYEMAHSFLWNRTQEGKEILKQCSIVDPSLTGEFGSKCSRNAVQTFWLHKTTCNCEKKSVVDYFKSKIAGVNKTNFMNISEELVRSAQAQEFINPKSFQDIFTELFNIATTQLLIPLTHQNADAALQYCIHVINTVLSSSPYAVSSSAFCKPSLDYDRNSLADKALEFLLGAPNDTMAFRQGSMLRLRYVRTFIKYPFKNNFRKPVFVAAISREELILQLNTAPLLSAAVSATPTPVVINNKNNETTRSNTSQANETKILQNNEARKPTITNEQIQQLLRANNCTRLTYDEEMESFLYHEDNSKEFQKQEKIQDTMETVLMSISIAAVVLALILLSALRLKNSERIFIHKSLLLSLGVGNLLYVLDISSFTTREKNTALCSALAVFQYYFQTALFTWMLVEGVNLYIKLVKVFSVKQQYATYIGIGWVIPAVMVGLVAAIRPVSFDMSKPLTVDITCGSLNLTARTERERCWINGSLWIYKGPILAILLVNLVLFVILIRVIFGKISSKYGNNRVIAARKGLRSTIALLPLLGVTWLVGFFIELHYAVGYLFILLNSTQGVLFAIFHCFLDDQVQEAIRKFCPRISAHNSIRTMKTAGDTPSSITHLTPARDKNMLQHSDESTTGADAVTIKDKHDSETNL